MVTKVRGWMLALGCVIWLLGQGAAGAAPASGPAAPAVDVNAFVRPFIDEQTMAVAHADVAKLDTAAIEQWLLGVMDEQKIAPDAAPRRELSTARTAADVFLTRFKQLGGRHVFVVLAHPDIWPAMQPLAVLVKIEPGGDAKMLRELLLSTLGMAANPEARELAAGTPEVAMLRDDVIFLGQEEAFKRLQTLKPASRPDLNLVQPDYALEVEAGLTRDQQRAIRELMPLLPAEVGGGSTEFLTRGPINIQLLVKLPPKPTVMLSLAPAEAPVNGLILSGTASGWPNPAQFAESDGLIVKLRDLLLASPEFAEAMKQPEILPMAAEVTAAVKEILTPSQGTLTVSDKHLRILARLLLPAVGQAQDQAQRMQTMTQIKQILVGCMVYAADNKGSLPATLEPLVDGKFIEAKMLVNPNDEKHRKWVYRRWAPELVKFRNPSTTPLVWEEVDADGSPRCVGFADGHVEIVHDKAALEALLKNAEAQFAPGAK